MDEDVFSRGERWLSKQISPGKEYPLEQNGSREKGRSRKFHAYHCPFCFSRLKDLYLMCEICNHIQGYAAPKWFHGKRKCQTASCHLRFSAARNPTDPPKNAQAFVCRSTREYSGCRRPLPSKIPWGQYPETHIGIVGPTAWKKLAVMTLLWQELSLGSELSAWSGESCWDQTTRELNTLTNQLKIDPQGLTEQLPKSVYTLGRTGLFIAEDGLQTRMLQFHNIPERWSLDEETLMNQALFLEYSRSLVFVFDMEQAARARGGLSEAATLLSRCIRVLERHRAGSLHRPFPGRVAVAVPGWTAADTFTDEEEALEEAVRRNDPHFWGLVKATAGPGVRFFGGTIPLGKRATKWAAPLLDYLIH
jgi:hypothetical protein